MEENKTEIGTSFFIDTRVTIVPQNSESMKVIQLFFEIIYFFQTVFLCKI